MDGEEEAIEQYNRAGAVRADDFAGVHWPDVALERENLVRLVEGVLETRVDFAKAAFGAEFDSTAAADRVEEAWRIEALQPRYAPEGVFVRAKFTVRVILLPEEAETNDVAPASEIENDAEETLTVTAEVCLSFVWRHHTRPFLDFMGGEIVRASDGGIQKLDPFAMEVSPRNAIAWDLNA